MKHHDFRLFLTKLNKKLSCRRESAHLTSLYHMVQKAFWYFESFRRHERDRQMDGWMDRL